MSNIITHPIIALLLCLLNITATAQNIDSLDASGGFYDIKLSDPIEKYIDQLYVRDSTRNWIPLLHIYKLNALPEEIVTDYRSDPPYYIYGNRINDIELSFSRGKLIRISFVIKELTLLEQQKIITNFEQLYGTPASIIEGIQRIWTGNKVLLLCLPGNKGMHIVYGLY